MSALRLINETVISSTVATVNIEDIFSSDFDVYKMTFTNFTSDADDSVMSARILSPQGNPDHFSNYDYAVQEGKSSGSTGEDRGVGQDNMQSFIGRMGPAAVGFGCTVYVFDPFSSTNYTQFLSEFTGLSGRNMRMFNGKFTYKKTNKVAGIQIRCNDDNFTGGNIRTYGLRSTP